MKAFPKIMCVDDDVLNLRWLHSILSKHFEAVSTFESASEALYQIGKDSSQAELIITNFWMPDLNGAEFIRVLRGSPDFKGKIIFTSSTPINDIEKKEATVTADYFVQKPLKEDKLLEVIHDLFPSI